MISLGEISQLMSGQDLNPDDYSDSIPSEYPYVTGASSLCEEGIVLNRWTSNPKRIAKRDDILLVCKGSSVGSLGKLANVEQAHIARQIMGIRAYNNVFQPFLYYLITSIIPNLKQKATGLIPGIDRDAFLSLHCCIPALPEQFRISSLLDNIDKRIAIQNKVIEDLICIKSSTTKRLLNTRDIPGQIVTLGEITEVISRRNKNRTIYPMYSVTNDRGFIPQSEQFEDREMVGEDIGAYRIIQKGEIAYNPARINVGSIALYKEEQPCMISSLYVCIRVRPGVCEKWLIQVLQSEQLINYYNLYAEGGVRLYLFYPNFSRIKVFMPAFEQQKKIADALEAIESKIELEKSVLVRYHLAKQALLSQLFI